MISFVIFIASWKQPRREDTVWCRTNPPPSPHTHCFPYHIQSARVAMYNLPRTSNSQWTCHYIQHIHTKEHMPCAYNVTLRRFRDNHCNHGKSVSYYIFWLCVCSLSYPTSTAYAQYCHLWFVWLYHIFPHYLIKDMIFGKKRYWTWNICFEVLHTSFQKRFLL